MSLTDFEQMKELLNILQKAVQYGFSTKSSPIDILLEALTDLSLILKRLFFEGSKGQRKNLGLKFSSRYSDELGNPKQFKVFSPSKLYWDPWTSKFFKSLASFSVLVKQGKNGKDSFMESFGDFLLTLHPKADYSSVKEPQKTKKDLRKRSIQATRAYYRRQSRKPKNQN
jgi:hypothetical protein